MPRISLVTFTLDPEFVARVERTYQVKPELLVRIIRSFQDDRPMAELAIATGLSHDVLNKIYCLKWRWALIAAAPAPTPSNGETLPFKASFSQSKESISDELVDRIKALTSLHIRSADICAWLGISHQQLREAKTSAVDYANDNAAHLDGSPTE